jgi:hypothetical protein
LIGILHETAPGALELSQEFELLLMDASDEYNNDAESGCVLNLK